MRCLAALILLTLATPAMGNVIVWEAPAVLAGLSDPFYETFDSALSSDWVDVSAGVGNTTLGIAGGEATCDSGEATSQDCIYVLDTDIFTADQWCTHQVGEPGGSVAATGYVMRQDMPGGKNGYHALLRGSGQLLIAYEPLDGSGTAYASTGNDFGVNTKEDDALAVCMYGTGAGITFNSWRKEDGTAFPACSAACSANCGWGAPDFTDIVTISWQRTDTGDTLGVVMQDDPAGSPPSMKDVRCGSN